jgi:hypothetical protein
MAPKSKHKYPLIRLDWIDAESGAAEWIEPSEIDGTLPAVTTIGFLIKETEDTYIIASTITDTHINGQFKVPKGMTKQKHELNVTYKKEKGP